jgi:hypothetical protein
MFDEELPPPSPRIQEIAMLLLLIIPIWALCLLVVAGLCAGARLGDAVQGSTEAAEPVAARSRQLDAAREPALGESAEARIELAA